jgi:hypothetical protein
MKSGRWRAILAATVVFGLLLTGCTSQEPEPVPTASVDDPHVLTDDQAERLAAMRFRNFASGIVGFDARLLSQEGDVALHGWIDFANRNGYASATAVGSGSVLMVWDAASVAFLDVESGEGPPPEQAPVGEWQTVPLDVEASDVTRMLAVLLLLSEDRPENAVLLRQNGARFLGEETLAGVLVERYSGVATQQVAGGEADLSTQYWLADGLLVQFAIRLSGSDLSTVTFDRDGGVPQVLPTTGEISGGLGGG